MRINRLFSRGIGNVADDGCQQRIPAVMDCGSIGAVQQYQLSIAEQL